MEIFKNIIQWLNNNKINKSMQHEILNDFEYFYETGYCNNSSGKIKIKYFNGFDFMDFTENCNYMETTMNGNKFNIKCLHNKKLICFVSIIL